MTDLSPEVLPSVWTLARHAVLRVPGLTRSDLIGILTPRELIARVGGSAGESRHVRPSVGALVEMGVLAEEDSGALRLTVGEESETAFRRAVTGLVFTPRGGPDEDVWRLRTELQPEHHAELALAWLHLQGVNTPISSFPAAESLLQAQFGLDRVLLRDTAPFGSFERLARWCGVAAHISEAGAVTRIVPDPTDAVRAELDELVPNGDELSAREVVDRASAIFAWLPTGSIGRAVASRMADVPDAAIAHGAVPEGFSLALVQLHHERLIELVPGDDASDRITLTPGGITDSSGHEVAAIARVRRRGAAE